MSQDQEAYPPEKQRSVVEEIGYISEKLGSLDARLAKVEQRLRELQYKMWGKEDGL